MSKKVFLFIFGLIPIVLIWMLHTICYKENIPNYNFKRKFVSKKMKQYRSIELKSQYIKIIGIIDNSLYLYTDDLTTLSEVNLQSKTENISKSNYSIQNANISNNKIYTFSIRPNSYSVLDKHLNLIESDTMKFNFDRGIHFKNNNYYRFTNSKSKGQFLLSNKSTPYQIAPYNVADSTIIDGGITTDGYFISGENELFYIEYHKGKYYQLEEKKITEFSMPYAFNNIDGFEKKGNTFLINRPIIPKNKFSCVDQNLLYNASFVKSNNQSLKEFTKQITVDVYDILSGKYLYSFYIPNHKNRKPIDMIIKNKSLYILYGKNITQFKIQ